MKKTNLIKNIILTTAATAVIFFGATATFAGTASFSNSFANGTIAVGQSGTVTAKNASASDSVQWRSEDPSALAVTGTGKTAKVTALEPNADVMIFATVASTKKTYTEDVKVATNIALTNISLNKTTTNINVGNSETLKVAVEPTNTTDDTTETWTTSNSKVATVSNGTVKAVAPGTATITAKVSGKTATCKVTVKAPLTKIALNKTSATLNSDSTLQLTVAYTPSNTTDSKTVTWTTSNSSIATVKNGKVTAIKSGTATITAKVSGKTATCKITVKAAGKFLNVNDCYTQLNNYRTKAGLKKLSKNTTLEGYAKTRAKELVKKFSHTRPNGQKGLSIIKGNLYKGENIAKGQTSCTQVMKAWYNSAGHRANMLHKHYTKVGIAGYKYNGQYYWVQLFSN